MELKVLRSNVPTRPWYAEGLQFTCTQCGNCCTGGPGYVWISKVEIQRLSEHLNIPCEEVMKKYCRRIGGKYSLKEHRSEQGEYDCTFLKQEKVQDKNGVVHTRRVCIVYPVRPLQCRTWPFWDGNLATLDQWNRAGVRCHGINRGPRHFTRDEIERLRDAKDWPENPPTSG